MSAGRLRAGFTQPLRLRDECLKHSGVAFIGIAERLHVVSLGELRLLPVAVEREGLVFLVPAVGRLIPVWTRA